jgi:putative phosphonate metabolism protein
MRYAIYFTPPPDHPLTQTGQLWLGRDAFTGTSIVQPILDGISPEIMARRTAFSRRYGFHGTIVAPFRLADEATEADLLVELEAFCSGMRQFELPDLRVDTMGNFIALTPLADIQTLQQLGDAAVARFSRYRAPLSDEEIKRRRSTPLTPRQNALLERWGYPYVMEEFRFHMTLAGPLAAEEQGAFHAAAGRFFASSLRTPVEFGGLALFAELEPGADFTIRSYVPSEKRFDRRFA